MDEKLAKLLSLVIEDVISTGEPVGSQRIVDAYKLPVSSATIRNWFAELEAQGFLMQTHTSSGRMPTEKGYRTYVDGLMERKTLGKRERVEIEAAFAGTDEEASLKSSAKAISDMVGDAVVLGLREADTYYTGLSKLFSQPEFHDWNRVINVSEVLDKLDDVLQKTRQQTYPEPIALIGGDCPFGSACGSILMTTRSGALIGLLGPIRMDYSLGFSLFRELNRLLTS